VICFIAEMSLASQSMYRTVKEAYEPEWVGYTELTSAVEVSTSFFFHAYCVVLCSLCFHCLHCERMHTVFHNIIFIVYKDGDN